MKKKLGIEFKLFFCYTLSNIPATPLAERSRAFWAGIPFTGECYGKI